MLYPVELQVQITQREGIRFLFLQDPATRIEEHCFSCTLFYPIPCARQDQQTNRV
jgi:hypothetical protein